MLTLDATTRAEYDAASTVAAKAQVVLDALGTNVSVVVYNGVGTVKGAGSMMNPWATRSGYVLTIGEVSTFTVGSSAAGGPDAAGWYLRFEGNGRWLRGSFGPGGSFTWSLGTWEVGQTGAIGTATATVPASTVSADLIPVWAIEAQQITFGWTIPAGLDQPLAPAGGNWPLAQYAYTVGGTPLYAKTLGPAAVTVNPSTGLLTLAAGLTAGIYPVTVDLSQPASTADSDYAARSTGIGVVWAHDFREPNELAHFLVGHPNLASAGSGGSGYTNPVGYVNHVTRRASTVGDNLGSSWIAVARALGSVTVGTTLSGATAIVVADAAQFPDPATAGQYYLLVGTPATQEWVRVTVRNTSTNTLTAVRGAFDGPAQQWPDGTPIGTAPNSKWIRPMCPIPATQNGRTLPDKGIENGFQVPPVPGGTVWDATPSTTAPGTPTHARYRWGHFGHTSYVDAYDDNYPDPSYGRTLLNIFTKNASQGFNADEFYAQWRCKLDPGIITALPGGKVMYLQNTGTSTWQQIFLNISPQYGAAAEPARINVSTNFGDVANINDGWPTVNYPLGRWFTFLLHVKPGREALAESTVELFLSDPTVNGGAYQTVVSKANQVLNYKQPIGTAEFPPAYNSFSPTNYPNCYVGSGSVGAPKNSFSVEFTQVILSRNTIAVPT
jgi:hypothetical protein